MELTGVRAAVLIEQVYQEMEVWYPVYRLREAGARVTLVGPEAGQTYASKLGYPAKSDKAARDVTAEDFDLVVIPGGYAPDHMRRWEIRESFMRKLPFAAKLHQVYMPLYPTAFEKFHLSPYDVVLSSSSAFAKGVIT